MHGTPPAHTHTHAAAASGGGSLDLSPAAARAIINASRRRKTLWQAVAIIVLGGLGCAAAIHGWGVAVLWIFGGLVAAVTLIPRDPCPCCGGNLSMLPGERTLLRLPELSRKVRACPFCGLDLAYETEAAPASQASVAAALASGSAPRARDAINAHRRVIRRIEIWVPLILVVLLVLWDASTSGGPGPPDVIFIAPFLLILLQLIMCGISSNDCCPWCGHDISMLPNAKRFGRPELSSAVRLCPYCRADYSDSAH